MRVYVSIQKLYSQYYFNECKCIYIYTRIYLHLHTPAYIYLLIMELKDAQST